MGTATSAGVLSMSDEDFGKLAGPPELEEPRPGSEKEEKEEKGPEEPAPEAPDAGEDPPAGTEPAAGADAPAPATDPAAEPTPAVEGGEEPVPAPAKEGKDQPSAAVIEPPAEPAKDPAKDPKAPAAKKEPEPKKDPEPKSAETAPAAPDYKAFYERVMAPFKANGKTVQLDSPEDVISLMQMGANYTKKMQAIQPYRKYLMMLENNQLLDENQLSFLIDLHKKNPEAIKKLLKDSNIDPVDIDTSSESQYKEGTHRVTDQEASFAAAMEDVKLLPGGLETLQSLTGWDSRSKKVLWENPGLMKVMHDQRESGVYARITAEVERRKALGKLDPNTSFIDSYKLVGDEMQARGAFNDLTKPNPTPAPPPVARATPPVAVRPARTSVARVEDNPKVRAAAPPRTATPKAGGSVNYLALSDDEFSKLASKV